MSIRSIKRWIAFSSGVSFYIFSLINFNTNFFHSCTTVNTLVSYLITAFALIGLIVGVLAPAKWIITMIIIFIGSAVMIDIAILLIYKVK